jgi:hypothetical protein
MGASLRKSASPPRTKSDYFSENPNDDVTPEAVLAAIARPSGDADARLQAYVKWQLLSALPEKVEEPKHAAALIRAYKTAPEPMPRPGVAPRERAQLDKLAQGAREADQPKVQEQFEKLLEQSDVGNGPILAYRDELLTRSPPSYETYVAAFGDAVQRLEAPPQQLNDMIKAVRQLKGKEGPDYYDRLEWDERSRRLTWFKRRNDLNDGKHLEDLVAFLSEQVKNSPGTGKYGR